MPSQKRELTESGIFAAGGSSGRRRSQRIAPAKKPKYAEDDSENSDEEELPISTGHTRRSSGAQRKSIQDSGSEANPTSGDSDTGDSEVDDEFHARESDLPPHKKGSGRSRPAGTSAKLASRPNIKPKPDWEGEEDDDDGSDDSGVRKVIVKPHPINRMKSDGGISYEDDKIHPNTIVFLRDLKANNNRQWLKGTHFAT